MDSSPQNKSVLCAPTGLRSIFSSALRALFQVVISKIRQALNSLEFGGPISRLSSSPFSSQRISVRPTRGGWNGHAAQFVGILPEYILYAFERVRPGKAWERGNKPFLMQSSVAEWTNLVGNTSGSERDVVLDRHRTGGRTPGASVA